MESYYKSEEEKQFVKNLIEREIYCLGNEFQELYSKQNEYWFEDTENMIDDNDEFKEVFQWFIVSEYLAQKLSEINEPILTTSSHYLWGRTCYGQSIELDGTFQEIYRRTFND